MSLPDLEEDVVIRLVAGGYNCTLLTKRGNRRLIRMEWGAGVDITIVPTVAPTELLPCHAVVYGGLAMRNQLENEKQMVDIDVVNMAALELKLAGAMLGLRDPGFTLEVVAALAVIMRGQQPSIWLQMKLIMEEWNCLCFQRAKGQDCDMCRYQDKAEEPSHDKTRMQFCYGVGMQHLDLEKTYAIIRMKAADEDHIIHLPNNNLTVMQLARYLPIMLRAEQRRGIRGSPKVFNGIITGYGVSTTDRMITEAVIAIGGAQHNDGRLYLRAN